MTTTETGATIRVEGKNMKKRRADTRQALAATITLEQTPSIEHAYRICDNCDGYFTQVMQVKLLRRWIQVCRDCLHDLQIALTAAKEPA